MKNKLAKFATAIRNNRKLKFLSIAGTVWIALLVFVGCSTKPKPKAVVIVDHRQSSVQSKHRARQRKSHSRAKTAAHATVPSSTNPCATPELRSQDTTGATPGSALPAPGHNQETRNAPMGLEGDQQHQERPRPDSPIVPNTTNSRLPAVVWVSAVASSSNNRLQTKVTASQQANVITSLAVQSRSDSGFRPFRKQAEIGKQSSGSGFKPFRP
jgi:hypothetical protein